MLGLAGHSCLPYAMRGQVVAIVMALAGVLVELIHFHDFTVVDITLENCFEELPWQVIVRRSLVAAS